MFKTRILLSVIIMVATAAIYFLPRYVVSNEPVASATPQDTEIPQATSTEDIHDHHFEIPDSLAPMFKSLYDLIANAENQEKRFIFADSLAKAYQLVGFQDSSAKYSAIRAQEIPTTENLLLAADSFYEAMNLMAEQHRRSALALKAGEYYKRILDENPELFDVKAKYAMTLTYGSNPMEGIMMLREVIEKDPANEMATMNLGILAITSGQFEKAKERFDNLLRFNPDHVEGNFYMGICLIEMGKSSEAVPYFEKVAKTEKSNLKRPAEEYLNSITN